MAIKINELPIMASVVDNDMFNLVTNSPSQGIFTNPTSENGQVFRDRFLAQDVSPDWGHGRILQLERELAQAKHDLAKTKTELRLAHGGEKNLRELKLNSSRDEEYLRKYAVSLTQEQLATLMGCHGAKVTTVRSEDYGHRIGLRMTFPQDHPVARGQITAKQFVDAKIGNYLSPDLRAALVGDDDPDFAEDLLFEVPKPELKAYRLNVDADLRKWRPTMIKVLDEQIHEVSGASAASWIADEQVPRGVIHDPHGVEQRRQIAALERKEEEPRQGSLGVVIHDPNGPRR